MTDDVTHRYGRPCRVKARTSQTDLLIQFALHHFLAGEVDQRGLDGLVLQAEDEPVENRAEEHQRGRHLDAQFGRGQPREPFVEADDGEGHEKEVQRPHVFGDGDDGACALEFQSIKGFNTSIG